MQKVIIIGCPGSGKTTFAEKLNKATALPLYHLDRIWHKSDGSHTTREDFNRRLSEIFDTPEWIIDGNYNRTIEMRLKRCDTVFLFDLSPEICIQGATERLGKERVDFPWVDKELSTDLKRSIEEFSIKSLPIIYDLLEKYKDGKEIIVFKSREAADDYLKSLMRISSNLHTNKSR